MKHTTFYISQRGKSKGEKRIYTTISHSPMHKNLRDNCVGVTYQHSDDAALYFVAGMLLDKPIGKHVEEVK
jgi:hypothetical protein